MGSMQVNATGDSPQLNVSSADFVRQFGQLRQRHGEETIVVTHHGRPTHVLLTAARYAAICQDHAAPVDTGLPSIRNLAEQMHNAVLVLNTDMIVTVANHIAHVLVGRTDGELIGRPVFDAVPELRGSLVETYVHRAVRGGEPCSAELPSLFRPDAWVRVEVHPAAQHTTILFHDITDDVQRHRLADAKKAIRDAVSVHGGINYVCINTRGHIEHADDSFYDLMHLPEARLRHVALSDLVPLGQRVAFRETMDAVLTGKGTCNIDTALLTNDGSTLPISASIAELRGIYGNEGAVLLLTRR